MKEKRKMQVTFVLGPESEKLVAQLTAKIAEHNAKLGIGSEHKACDVVNGITSRALAEVFATWQIATPEGWSHYD